MASVVDGQVVDGLSAQRYINTGLILVPYNQAESFPTCLAKTWRHATFSQIQLTKQLPHGVCKSDVEWSLALTEVATHKLDPRSYYKMEVSSWKPLG